MSLPFEYAPLRNVLDALPRTLRASVIAYLDRVEEHVPVIFERAGVAVTHESRERFILGCALRKVWVTIDSQYWTMTSAVSLMRRFDLREAAIGSARYGQSTTDFQSIVQLRAGLSAQLAQLGLTEIAFADSLAEVASETG